MDDALGMEQWKIENGIVFCSGNLEKQDHITYLPWYMSMFMEQKKVETGFIVDVNLEGLNYIKEEHNEIEWDKITTRNAK